MSERLAKFMARSGVCSRRRAEEYIRQKRVTVNGEVVDSPAFNVEGTEKILFDGEKLPEIETTRLWLYYKPVGLLTTHRDDQNRPTVFDSLPPFMPIIIITRGLFSLILCLSPLSTSSVIIFLSRSFTFLGL